MSAHAVSLAETDQLESFVVPFIPPALSGVEEASGKRVSSFKLTCYRKLSFSRRLFTS